MQASRRRALRPDHAVRHAYVDRHLAAGVLPDSARRTATHPADRHCGTGGWLGSMMFQGAEYFSFGGDVLAAVDTLHAAYAR